MVTKHITALYSIQFSQSIFSLILLIQIKSNQYFIDQQSLTLIIIPFYRFHQSIVIIYKTNIPVKASFVSHSLTRCLTKILKQTYAMVFPQIKSLLKPILNWHSLVYLTQVYLQCLAYLLPVLITYLLTKNYKTTLYALAIMVITRFGVIGYEIWRSNKKAPKPILYASCFRGVRIDEFQKINRTATCQMQYQVIKEENKRMSNGELKEKEDAIDEIATQLEIMERTIFNHWED